MTSILKNYIFITWALVGIILSIALVPTNAQQNSDINWKDRYVTLKPGDNTDQSVARPAQSDYSVVVWISEAAGSSAGVYAQKIRNSDGLPLWSPADGVLVSTFCGYMPRNPKAAYDSLGGVYVVWEAYSVDGGGSKEIFAQRLSLNDGLRNWTDQGIQVSEYNNDSYDHDIVCDQQGVYVVWTDQRNGTPEILYACIGYDGSERFATEQLSDNYGHEYGKPVITIDGVVDNNHMGVYIAWVDDNAGFPEIRGVHVNEGGIPSSDSPYLLLNTYPYHECRNPRIMNTGPVPGLASTYSYAPAGAVIVWEEDSVAWNLKAQNLDFSDSLRFGRSRGPQYTTSVPVCTYAADQVNHAITSSQENYVGDMIDFILCHIAWEDYRENATSGVDIYTNTFEVLTGTIIAPATGVATCTVSGNQMEPAIDYFDSKLTVSWTDYRAGESDIWLQQFDRYNAGMVWGTNCWPVTRAIGAQTNSEVLRNMFFYLDTRRGDQNIYTQMLNASLSSEYGPTQMQYRGQYSFVDSTLTASSYSVCIDSLENTYTVWAADDGTNYSQVYIQKHDQYGTPLWANGGIPIGKSGMNNVSPKLCVGIEGSVFVAWVGDSLYFCHVNSNGVYSRYGLTTNASHPAIVRDDDGTNHAYLAYTRNHLVQVYEIASDGSRVVQNHGILYDYGNGAEIVTRSGGWTYWIASQNGQSIPSISYSSGGGASPVASGLYNKYDFALSCENTAGNAGVIIVAHDDYDSDAALAVFCNGWNQQRVTICNDWWLDIVSSGISVVNEYDYMSSQTAVYVTWCSYDSHNGYQVRCNAAYQGGGVAYNPSWPPVLESLPDATTTDMVLLSKPFAVWSGYGPSGSGKSVKAQYVDYSDSTSVGYWSSGAKFVSAHPGGISQLDPMIAKSNTVSMPTIMFRDGSSYSNYKVLGARIYDDGGNVQWYKGVDVERTSLPVSLQLSTPYPQPYSLSSGSSMILPMTLKNDDVINVSVYDMFGRKIFEESTNGWHASQNEYVFSGDAMRKMLTPGLYVVRASAGENAQTMKIVVTR